MLKSSVSFINLWDTCNSNTWSPLISTIFKVILQSLFGVKKYFNPMLFSALRLFHKDSLWGWKVENDIWLYAQWLLGNFSFFYLPFFLCSWMPQWYFMVSEAIKHCVLYKSLILKPDGITCDVFYIFLKWMDGWSVNPYSVSSGPKVQVKTFWNLQPKSQMHSHSFTSSMFIKHPLHFRHMISFKRKKEFIQGQSWRNSRLGALG